MTNESSPIDKWSSVPLHLQVRDHLVALMEKGELKPGRALPPEKDLAAHYGVSLAPVRQALLGLMRDGLLHRVRGRGTFVRQQSVVAEISHLVSFSETMRSMGFRVEVDVLRDEFLQAPTDVAAGLQLPDRRVLLLERLATVDGEPFSVLTTYLPKARFSAMHGCRLEDGSIYNTLRKVYGIVPTRAETLIGLVPCSTSLSPLLNLPSGTPLLSARGVTFDAVDEPFEFFEVLYRPDRVQLHVDSHRLAATRLRPSPRNVKRLAADRQERKTGS